MNILLPLVTLDSVTTFLRDEGFKAVDAECLGKYLDGPSSQLEELKTNNIISLLRDIIQCWLKNNFNPSWNSLAVALGYRQMADKIRVERESEIAVAPVSLVEISSSEEKIIEVCLFIRTHVLTHTCHRGRERIRDNCGYCFLCWRENNK